MSDPHIHSIKSNARRQARNDGLDPDTCVHEAAGGGWYVKAPGAARKASADDGGIPAELRLTKEQREETWKKNPPKRAAHTTKTPAPKMPKAKSAKARKAAKTAGGGDKMAFLLAGLKDKNGISMPEIMKATGWLEHTARARISNVAKANKLKIERVKVAGVNIYRPVG